MTSLDNIQGDVAVLSQDPLADPSIRFRSHFERLLETALSVTIIGTGVTVIRNSDLWKRLLDRASKQMVELRVCLGNVFAPAVTHRLAEERAAGDRHNFDRAAIESNIRQAVKDFHRHNLPQDNLRLFGNYPAWATILIDGETFIFLYPFGELGNTSPVFYFRDPNSEAVAFVRENARRVLEGSVRAIDVLNQPTTDTIRRDWAGCAVFLVPKSGHRLDELGVSLFGRSLRRPEGDPLELSGLFPQFVGNARSFGMHCTLAPAVYFPNPRLLAQAIAEVKMIADEFHQITLIPSQLSFRLAPDGTRSLALECQDFDGTAIAMHCEILSKVWRYAVSLFSLDYENLSSRTGTGRLSAFVDRYKTDAVLSKYVPRFTLLGAVPSNMADAGREKILQGLRERCQAVKQIVFDSICFVTYSHGERHWNIAAEYPLGRGSQ